MTNNFPSNLTFKGVIMSIRSFLLKSAATLLLVANSLHASALPAPDVYTSKSLPLPQKEACSLVLPTVSNYMLDHFNDADYGSNKGLQESYWAFLNIRAAYLAVDYSLQSQTPLSHVLLDHELLEQVIESPPVETIELNMWLNKASGIKAAMDYVVQNNKFLKDCRSYAAGGRERIMKTVKQAAVIADQKIDLQLEKSRQLYHLIATSSSNQLPFSMYTVSDLLCSHDNVVATFGSGRMGCRQAFASPDLAKILAQLYYVHGITDGNAFVSLEYALNLDALSATRFIP
jgi:hypothetical protein